MPMEGLLLQGDGDLAKRLSDAIALRLGQSIEERTKLGAIARQVYDVRSRYVHGSEYQGAEVLRHEMFVGSPWRPRRRRRPPASVRGGGRRRLANAAGP